MQSKYKLFLILFFFVINKIYSQPKNLFDEINLIKSTNLPYILNKKYIENNIYFTRDSNNVRNRISKETKYLLFNRNFNCCLNEDVNFYFLNKIEIKNFIILISYHHGSAGGLNEEYYISIIDRDFNLVESKLVAYFSMDNSDSIVGEFELNSNLMFKIKQMKTKSNNSKLIKKQYYKYKINNITGKISKIASIRPK